MPGEDWLLVDATGTPNPASFRVTLRFSDGQVAGQGPVNRYSGQVTLGQGTIQTSAVASTKMAGPPEATAAEQAYFDALGKATTWEVMDEMLTLSDATGPLLVYAAPDSVAAFAASLVGLTHQAGQGADRRRGVRGARRVRRR
ncbi:MAG: META domain-containing protein [Candidatus Nanopelagicales bacterium]